MNLHVQKTIVILFFIAVFVSVGWIAPALYASYSPESMYIEGHSFETTNSTLSSENHAACFDRTIKERATGEVFTELFIVTENGERIELQSAHENRAFTKGRETVRISTSLPDAITEGEYRYERVYKMELQHGRVVRTFTFQSEPFYITNESQPETMVLC